MSGNSPEIEKLIDQVNYDWEAVKGGERLWRWFGLTRASWLTLPRVLLHEMPDDWQEQMARLLEQFDQAFPNWIPGQLYVNLKENGRFTSLPEALCNYRHPRADEIDAYRVSVPL